MAQVVRITRRKVPTFFRKKLLIVWPPRAGLMVRPVPCINIVSGVTTCTGHITGAFSSPPRQWGTVRLEKSCYWVFFMRRENGLVVTTVPVPVNVCQNVCLVSEGSRIGRDVDCVYEVRTSENNPGNTLWAIQEILSSSRLTPFLSGLRLQISPKIRMTVVMGDPSFELMSENFASLSPTDDNLMMVWKSQTNINTKEIKIAWCD